MGMLEPGHACRPGAVRADAARRLQANLLRHRVGRREGTEGDEEGHHARPGSGRRRGLCRRRDQSGGSLHGRITGRDPPPPDPNPPFPPPPAPPLPDLSPPPPPPPGPP